MFYDVKGSHWTYIHEQFRIAVTTVLVCGQWKDIQKKWKYSNDKLQVQYAYFSEQFSEQFIHARSTNINLTIVLVSHSCVELF